MIRPFALVLALTVPSVSVGQSSITIDTIELPDTDDPSTVQTRPTPGFQQPVIEPGEVAQGAVLRALDKVSGQTTDIELRTGESAEVFALDVGLNECRFPAGNPAGDAFAYLIIRDTARQGALFTGWMVASSPALSALDHARYDVWVLRCITS